MSLRRRRRERVRAADVFGSKVESIAVSCWRRGGLLAGGSFAFPPERIKRKSGPEKQRRTGSRYCPAKAWRVVLALRGTLLAVRRYAAHMGTQPRYQAFLLGQ